MRQVAVQELLVNLKSLRLIIMALVSALVIVGGAYGFSGLGSGGGFPGGLPPVVVWPHAAYNATGSHVAVVWVSDPFGGPQAGRTVDLEALGPNGTVPLAKIATDGNGFVRHDVGGTDVIAATVTVGSFQTGTTISFPPQPQNFTYDIIQGDLDRDGSDDEMAIHVVNVSGDVVPAQIAVNGTSVGSTDAHGYLQFDLPRGDSIVNVTVAGETQTFPATVRGGSGGPTFASGPDTVLIIIAALSGFIVSLFGVVLSFDAVSKERVQGTMDLLLSRPASRSGILLGKFLGAFAAVALPVTLVNLAGIGVIAAVSGKSPTGSFAAAFLGLSLLLIATYVLLQLSLSTIAKTSGTAILFGVLAWLLFNLLYPIITFVIGAALFANDPAGYFHFSLVSGLGSPTQVYFLLIGLAAPQSLAGSGGTAVDPILPEAAAVAWIVLLLLLALWTFHKRGPE